MAQKGTPARGKAIPRSEYQALFGRSYWMILRLAKRAGYPGVYGLNRNQVRALVAQQKERQLAIKSASELLHATDLRVLRHVRIPRRTGLSWSTIRRLVEKKNKRLADLSDPELVRMAMDYQRKRGISPPTHSEGRKVARPAATSDGIVAVAQRHTVLVHGERRSLSAWSRICGVADQTIRSYARRHYGGNIVASVQYYLERLSAELSARTGSV